MSNLMTISICIDDLDMSKANTAKNGKKYLNMVLEKRKQVGQYGDTHALTYSQTKEQRAAKEKKEYVKGASAKEYVFGGNGGYSKPSSNNSNDDFSIPF